MTPGNKLVGVTMDALTGFQDDRVEHYFVDPSFICFFRCVTIVPLALILAVFTLATARGEWKAKQYQLSVVCVIVR